VNDDAWIKSFLRRAPFGVLATVHGQQPFINSNLFVYDDAAHAIYMHTARTGRTRNNIEESPLVCFSISHMGRLLPAAEALEFSVEYAGVTIFGSAEVVTEAEEARHGLQLLLDKYAPHLRAGRDYRPITADELARTGVYRVKVEQWSGKKKEADANFPGAFRFGDEEVVALREYRQGEYLISTDRDSLDVDLIYRFLDKEAYWSPGITREKIVRYINNSLCFGIYDVSGGGRRQTGFGRAITDFVTLAHLADIFVLEPYRRRGLGSWMMKCILAHPELDPVPVWTLNTRDAHDFYRQFQFEPQPGNDNRMVMHRRRPAP
jgi:hypothetical protein